LLKTRLSDGRLLVEGKTWTGFANSEEKYAAAITSAAIARATVDRAILTRLPEVQ